MAKVLNFVLASQRAIATKRIISKFLDMKSKLSATGSLRLLNNSDGVPPFLCPLLVRCICLYYYIFTHASVSTGYFARSVKQVSLGLVASGMGQGEPCFLGAGLEAAWENYWGNREKETFALLLAHF